MQFNDVSTSQGIVQDVYFRTGTNSSTFPTADITRYSNEAMSRVAFLIITSDGRMKWDDSNHTDQPTSETALANGQKDYGLFSDTPSALQDWLEVERIEVLDEAGNAYTLDPIDKSDYTTAESEFMKGGGVPRYFEVDGTQINLYPTPNYDKASGLIIYFNRAPSYFAAADTTKRPGFATIFHPYIPLYVSNVWNGTKKQDWSLQSKLNQIEGDIQKFYSRRAKYDTPRLQRAVKKFK